MTFERMAQGRRGIAGFFNDGRGSLVAGGFDTENEHIDSASEESGRFKKDPALRSVGRVLWTRRRIKGRTQRLGVGRAEDPPLGDDAG